MTQRPTPNLGIAALRRLQSWDGLRRLDERLAALRRRPNLFLIAPRILRVEGVHSDVIAWLLDPQGWHGLGQRFVGAFARAVLDGCEMLEDEAFTVDEVYREFSTGEGPVDLLLRGRARSARIVLGIENKIDSSESADQLTRYGNGLAAKFATDQVILAFLTLDGCPPKAPSKCSVPIVPVSYHRVADLLEQAIKAARDDGAGGAGLELADQYLWALRIHVMRNPEPDKEIVEICRELYREHREAWRAIRRRLPSDADEAHAYLASRVCESLTSKIGDKWQYRISQDRCACVFRPGWCVLGSYERDRLVGLSLPGETTTCPRIHFRLVAKRDDSDMGSQFQYLLLLKVDASHEPVRAMPVLKALREHHKLKDSAEFSVQLKSKTGLPGINESGDVPDLVVDWFVRHIAEWARLLDSALPKS